LGRNDSGSVANTQVRELGRHSPPAPPELGSQRQRVSRKHPSSRFWTPKFASWDTQVRRLGSAQVRGVGGALEGIDGAEDAVDERGSAVPQRGVGIETGVTEHCHCHIALGVSEGKARATLPGVPE